MTRDEIIAKLCDLQAEVARNVCGYDSPNDCFCGDTARGGKVFSADDFRSSGEAVDYIVRVVRASLYHAPRQGRQS